MRHYVYYLLDPDNQVRYVGLTTDPERRFREHCCSDRRRATGDRYDEWKASWTYYPTLDVVCILETLEEGRRVENALILLLRRRGVQIVNGVEEERVEKIRQACLRRSPEFHIRNGERISKALQALPVERRAGGAIKDRVAWAATVQAAWTPEKRAEHGRKIQASRLRNQQQAQKARG